MATIQHTTDMIVVGAGPAGLFTIFEAGMLKMRCHVIDTLDFIGGQCSALYPEKPIYDIPAYPHISAQDLITNLDIQTAPFKPVYHLGQCVEKMHKQGDLWRVTTSKGTVIEAKVVVIAAGCGAFGPNRPPIENIEQYEGTSVFYLVRRRDDFKDKRIVIAGGGDSAIDWALSLADIAKSVSLVHRRPKFRCAPESHRQLMERVAQGKIDLVVPYQLANIKGHDSQLDAIVVQTLEGQEKIIEADILLPFFGLAVELGPIADWGLNLDKKHITVDPTTMQTSLKNVYAIGDIATYPHKLKLILTGFSEAAMACHAARNSVFPDTEQHFEYSTTSGIAGF